MNNFNVYICGVGGQGIGLLSEILLRGGDYAGFSAKAVDTHGLAQRGGIVISHLRFGKTIQSPMIPGREADLVIALERHEAIRGADVALRDGGTLIYYNTVLQPLGVRLGTDKEISEEQIQKYCDNRNIKAIAVKMDGISDPRMQNIAVLAVTNKNGLIPGVKEKHLIKSMEDLMTGPMLESNIELFNSF